MAAFLLHQCHIPTMHLPFKVFTPFCHLSPFLRSCAPFTDFLSGNFCCFVVGMDPSNSAHTYLHIEYLFPWLLVKCLLRSSSFFQSISPNLTFLPLSEAQKLLDYQVTASAFFFSITHFELIGPNSLNLTCMIN